MPYENGFLKLLFCHLRKKAKCKYVHEIDARGRIFSRVRPFNERAVSDLDRSMHRSLWV